MKKMEIMHHYQCDLWKDGVCEDKDGNRNWLLACLNPLRQRVQQTAQMKQTNTMLSSGFLYYYDIYEKCVAYLENPQGSEPITAGGDFARFRHLIETYGIVPLSAMPDMVCHAHRSDVFYLLNNRLCYAKMQMEKGMPAADVKAHALQDVAQILESQIGTPPARFKWQYMRCDEDIISMENLTPRDFYYFFCKTDLQTFQEVLYKDADLKALSARQLLAGDMVIVSCDIRHQSNQMLGVLDTDYLDNETVFGRADIKITRAEKEACGMIAPTRWLTLDGVELDENGQVMRFKAQDTAGAETGADGHYMMSAAWFEEYVCSAVLKKEYLQ